MCSSSLFSDPTSENTEHDKVTKYVRDKIFDQFVKLCVPRDGSITHNVGNFNDQLAGNLGQTNEGPVSIEYPL